MKYATPFLLCMLATVMTAHAAPESPSLVESALEIGNDEFLSKHGDRCFVVSTAADRVRSVSCPAEVPAPHPETARAWREMPEALQRLFRETDDKVEKHLVKTKEVVI